MENLGFASPNVNNMNTTTSKNKNDIDLKINAYQTSSEFYNPNKSQSRNGKQTASLPRVHPNKKANYVSDNEMSVDMPIIDDEEFETKRINAENEPRVMKIIKKHPKID